MEELPDKPANNSNLEDYLGCYALLGVNLCRKTSPAEINKHYRIKKMQFRKDILAAHPDHNNGEDKGCQEINEKWRKVDTAHKDFYTRNSDGLSGRLLCDMECDKLRKTWKNMQHAMMKAHAMSTNAVK